MKKLFLSSVVLLVALVAQAQTKIAPKLENGFKAVYTEESTLEAGAGPIKMTAEVEYAVSDVTASGAIITVATKIVSTEADDSNPMSSLLTASSKLMDGIAVKFNTDAEGKVLGVANLDEVKAKAGEQSKALIDEIYKNIPQLSGMVPREGLEAQFAGSLTETALIQSITNNGVLGLNGKTIMNGATENYENEQGIKMKRMYFTTGKSIIANASLDMTTDELKTFIIKQVEEAAPEQAEMVKQNIDMLIGQLKPEVTAKTTYTMQDNGWPLSIKSETSQNMMGQSQKQTSVITLKQ